MSVTTQDLEKFVVECQPKFGEIRTYLNAFNIFNVLGVQHREIRHSNFLGWLFDPNETHQMGDLFFKGLLELLRKRNLIDEAFYIQLLLKDLSATQVYRESKHKIDILIVNEDIGFVICVENKIYADFSKHQLREYYNYVESHYENLPNRLFLILTPKPSYRHHDFSSGKYYANIDYQMIISLLELNSKYINQAIPTVKESINQYIAMVKKDITKTSEEVVLAREIYKTFKAEIDFIIKNQQDFAIFRDELAGYIKTGKLEGFVMSHNPHNNVIHLLPDDNRLLKLFHCPSAKSWGGDYIFSLILFFEQNNVWMKFGFGNITDSKEKETNIQLKTRLYNEMYDFDVFKKQIGKKFHFQLHPKNPLKDYTGVAGIRLFDDEDFAMSDKPFNEFFMEKFELINTMLVQPWLEECFEKLSSLPLNSN